MSRPARGSGELPRGASAAVLKGAALIALAVVLGLFLLERTDTSGSAATARPASKTTTTTAPRATTTTSSATTTTVKAAPAKSPDQLRLLVLNGGAPSGSAAQMRSKLQQVGYTNQPQATTWTGHQQTGNTIMCRPGQDAAAVALSQQTALQGAKVTAWPSSSPPSVTADVDCVVVVGA
jgi:hypothetical protein